MHGSSTPRWNACDSRSGARTSSCRSNYERSQDMGGGNYSLRIARANRAAPNAAFQQPNAQASGRLHEALNPFGKAREVNNVTPIVVALDVTRSRGDDTKLVYEKLPALM